MTNTKRIQRERIPKREQEKWRMRQRKCHTLVVFFRIGIDDDDGAVILALLFVLLPVVYTRSSELAELNLLDTILNRKKRSDETLSIM